MYPSREDAESIGKESVEALGFANEEDFEFAIKSLMQSIDQEDLIAS